MTSVYMTRPLLLVLLVTAIYYVRLDARWGLGITVTMLLMHAAAGFVSFWWHAGLFVVGWVLQFVGHGVYEKNRPAFAKTLTELEATGGWVPKKIRERYPWVNEDYPQER